MEFLWGVMALFIISTACSWWFHRRTSSVGMGAIFNALLFAWSAASIFPLTAFVHGNEVCDSNSSFPVTYHGEPDLAVRCGVAVFEYVRVRTIPQPFPWL